MRPRIASLARLGAALLLCSLALRGPLPALAAGPQVTITSVDAGRNNPPRVNAHITVTNSYGMPVPGLTINDFRPTEDGRPVQNVNLAAAANAAEPLRVVLALDSGGGMAFGGLGDVQYAARTFVGLLGPQDLVAAFGYGGGLPRDITVAADHAPALAAINSLRGSGDTRLNDAVFAAVNELVDAPSGRRAVLVLSDGTDTASSKTLDDAIAYATDRAVPVFALGFGALRADPLQRLADRTGGLFRPGQDLNTVPAFLQDVIQRLRLEYVLSYDGDGRNAESVRELQLGVNANGQTGQASARYGVAATISPHVTPAFVTPAENQHVRGSVRLTADIQPAISAQSARFFADDKLIGAVDKQPFQFDWQTRGLLNGNHTLRIEATGIDGQTESATRTVLLTASGSDVPVSLGLAGLLMLLGALAVAIVLGRRRRPAEHAPEAVEEAQQGWLVEHQPDGHTWPWPLSEAETLIGREVTNPNVLLDDEDVSRRHAAIRREDGGYIFYDLGPTNPTRINGRTVHEPHRLHEGDELILGNTRLVFMSQRPAEQEERLVYGLP